MVPYEGFFVCYGVLFVQFVQFLPVFGYKMGLK